MNGILYSIVVLLIVSCSHSEQQEKPKAPLSAKPASKGIKAKPTGQTSNWHAFFQKAPSEDQITMMKQKLDTWLNSDQIASLTKAARTQAVLGHYDASIQSYRAVIRNQPDNTRAIIELSQVYLRQGRLDRSFASLKEAKQNIDNNEQPDIDTITQYEYTLGLAYIKKGNELKGHSILSKLISKDPSFSPAYAAMSSSYLKRNKLELSEFIAKRGLDRGKEDSSLTNLLGVIAYKRGKIVEAKRWLKRSLKQNPNFVPAIINRANISVYRGEYESAEAGLKRAISLKPDSGTAYTVLGILYRKQSRFKESEAALLKALDLNPESAHSRYNLAVLKAKSQDDPGQALRLFHEVLQITSSDKKLTQEARMSIESLKDTSTLRNL